MKADCSHALSDGKPKTMSVEDAGALLGVSRNTAYEAAKRGEIPTIKIGRLLRVPVAPFERMLGLSAGNEIALASPSAQKAAA